MVRTIGPVVDESTVNIFQPQMNTDEPGFLNNKGSKTRRPELAVASEREWESCDFGCENKL
jgi:hypothetical protein